MGLDVEQCYNTFVNILTHSFIHFVPLKSDHTIKPPWVKNMSKRLQTERSTAWRKYKNYRRVYGRNDPITIQCWLSYRDVNIQYKLDLNNAISNYEHSLAFSSDSKRFHGYLRRKKVDRPSVGPFIIDGSWVYDNASMANHLADCYSSIFSNEFLPNPQPH